MTYPRCRSTQYRLYLVARRHAAPFGIAFCRVPFRQAHKAL